MRRFPSLPSSTARCPRRFSAVVTMLLTLGLAGCGSSTGPEESALKAAEGRWRTVRPASNSYAMQQRILCFCAFSNSEFRVTVVDGTIVAATPLEPPPNGLPTPGLSSFRTIDQLFAEVRSALGKSGMLQEVVYDPVAGYPTRLSLDPVRNAIDDEVTYETREVGPIPETDP